MSPSIGRALVFISKIIFIEYPRIYLNMDIIDINLKIIVRCCPKICQAMGIGRDPVRRDGGTVLECFTRLLSESTGVRSWDTCALTCTSFRTGLGFS